ncbi:hypothetical protein DFH27DRAFT_657006 [Peziza echinospora]|nr:hypothetical protein DFH27DRAFT_657006 [Peziza echinospora]
MPAARQGANPPERERKPKEPLVMHSRLNPLDMFPCAAPHCKYHVEAWLTRDPLARHYAAFPEHKLHAGGEGAEKRAFVITTPQRLNWEKRNRTRRKMDIMDPHVRVFQRGLSLAPETLALVSGHMAVARPRTWSLRMACPGDARDPRCAVATLLELTAALPDMFTWWAETVPQSALLQAWARSFGHRVGWAAGVSLRDALTDYLEAVRKEFEIPEPAPADDDDDSGGSDDEDAAVRLIDVFTATFPAGRHEFTARARGSFDNVAGDIVQIANPDAAYVTDGLTPFAGRATAYDWVCPPDILVIDSTEAHQCRLGALALTLTDAAGTKHEYALRGGVLDSEDRYTCYWIDNNNNNNNIINNDGPPPSCWFYDAMNPRVPAAQVRDQREVSFALNLTPVPSGEPSPFPPACIANPLLAIPAMYTPYLTFYKRTSVNPRDDAPAPPQQQQQQQPASPPSGTLPNLQGLAIGPTTKRHIIIVSLRAEGVSTYMADTTSTWDELTKSNAVMQNGRWRIVGLKTREDAAAWARDWTHAKRAESSQSWIIDKEAMWGMFLSILDGQTETHVKAEANAGRLVTPEQLAEYWVCLEVHTV